jgi:hypothetical protein
MPRPEKVETMLRTFFAAEGHATPELRRAVADLAGDAPSGEVPASWVPYVEKVARHAYEITDDDVAALRAAGHDEDAIFEVTIAAALGASLRRMDTGLRALAAATPAPKGA